jgi:hypothetical protein
MWLLKELSGAFARLLCLATNLLCTHSYLPFLPKDGRAAIGAVMIHSPADRPIRSS